MPRPDGRAAGQLRPPSQARTSPAKTGITTSRAAVRAFGSCASDGDTVRTATEQG